MPQRICYFDAFSGVSGDMLVGALADAGAPQDRILDALNGFGLEASYSFERVKRAGIAATKFHVVTHEAKKHRHLGPILKMIDGSAALSDRTKSWASRTFQRLGEAEASVHGTPIEKVHFHEVGAADSISDIVGACLALDLLGVDDVFCSPVNTGSGTVETEHGTLPVPAPATARLLEGYAVYASGPAMELTTPTGAAVVSTLARRFGPLPSMTIASTGFGAGTKDFPGRANVLRVLIGEATGAAEATQIDVIEANIDDLSPQILGYAMERLLEAGALDVSMQPIEMKKSRPGTLLRVLAKPEDREALAAILFAETTTLGLRITQAERRVQSRRWVDVATPWGAVRMKIAGGGSYAPEYEDCRKVARDARVPLKDVIAAANFAYLSETK